MFLLLAAACDDRSAPSAPSPRPSFVEDPASGEIRARIALGDGAAAEMRSGPTVPVSLPPGFTIYPGARIVGNTLVRRGGARIMLVEFETRDPIAKVMLFHRAQAVAADVALELDLDGSEAASIAGRTTKGGDYAVTARRQGGRTQVQLAISQP